MKYFKITDTTGNEAYASSTRADETVTTLGVALRLNNEDYSEITEITYNEFSNETEKVFTDSEEN